MIHIDMNNPKMIKIVTKVIDDHKQDGPPSEYI